MLKIGWFSTGRDQAARQLLTAAWEAIAGGQLDARIAVVFCNRQRGEHPESDRFLDLVEGYSLPLVCHSYVRFRRERGLPSPRPNEPLPPWRLEYDREVMNLLTPYTFDLGVLAGYMLIVGPEMCQRLRLINLHPAPPGGPAGTWQEVIWQLMAQGAERSGVMMHLVTPDLDQGPPVTYCTYSLRGPTFDPLWREVAELGLARVQQEQGENNRLFQEIRRHGLARELPLVIATLRAFAQGQVHIRDGRVLGGDGQPISGYDLTVEIDAMAADALKER